MAIKEYSPGTIVKARDREWIVCSKSKGEDLWLRPLGRTDEDATLFFLGIEPIEPVPASFPLPDPEKSGTSSSVSLLMNALKLKLRSGAGPFRSFGNLSFKPRAYQLVPLMVALKHDVTRLLIADDVGIGKTIEAGMIARELWDRGEINRIAVICPPHLCDQWEEELRSRFNLQGLIIKPSTAAKLEREIPPDQSIFQVYPITIISLDYIKSDRLRDEFCNNCAEFVIVDEAHTCVQGSGSSKHQRYQLLKKLAEDQERHMLFLTATPHSGDDTAFFNLLGLLDPEFQSLSDFKGSERDALRKKLANHFIHRRRADIAEWKEDGSFPDRETREETYKLNPEWQKFMGSVLAFARHLIEKSKDESKQKQRMNWWAAIALLRCVSSSPEAAKAALETKMNNYFQEEELEEYSEKHVYDLSPDQTEYTDETPPPANPVLEDGSEEAIQIQELLSSVSKITGVKNDPKLSGLYDILKDLIKDGFNPVIFCRYIATAHYVKEEIAKLFGDTKYHIELVTGELAPDERKIRIKSFKDSTKIRILIATDCLSEGINLQDYFDAVVHYDLSWNPSRHEQREGRVDRYGQHKPTVRAVMYYGNNNPVDGAVLQVLLRKADEIRKELGIHVPIPEDNNKVMEAIMEAILFKNTEEGDPNKQLELLDLNQFKLDSLKKNLEGKWQSAKEKYKRTNTIFAQRSLKPSEVLPEYLKTQALLGTNLDTESFMRIACEKLKAPLEKISGGYRVPFSHLPSFVRNRLEAYDLSKTHKISFDNDQSEGYEFIHRTHPYIHTLADTVTEIALEEKNTELFSRASAMFVPDVDTITYLLLLRIRNRLITYFHDKKTNKRIDAKQRDLIVEECQTVAIKSNDKDKLILDTNELLKSKPIKNMQLSQIQHYISHALEQLSGCGELLNKYAQTRADALMSDHKRVRESSGRTHIHYHIEPCLPVDIVGLAVLVPSKA
jgi:superfamily II DNA or RNA helicase